jgi:hypothetical protein
VRLQCSLFVIVRLCQPKLRLASISSGVQFSYMLPHVITNSHLFTTSSCYLHNWKDCQDHSTDTQPAECQQNARAAIAVPRAARNVACSQSWYRPFAVASSHWQRAAWSRGAHSSKWELRKASGALRGLFWYSCRCMCIKDNTYVCT